MNIDSIQNGVVIDHITAGRALRIYDLLNLNDLDCSVAIIKNVNSKKMGKKDTGQAVKSGIGSVIGFLCGTVMKCVLCGYMTWIFFESVFNGLF